jgi:RNA recognition motif-containing protein
MNIFSAPLLRQHFQSPLDGKPTWIQRKLYINFVFRVIDFSSHDEVVVDWKRDKMTDAARWKATVHVGGLAPLVTQGHVLDAFIPFGEIVEVQVPKSDAPNSTDPHRGFAYVEYEDAADAKEAIDNMDQSELFGRVIKVSQAKAPKSAEEGLGSRRAVWEQVSPTHLCRRMIHANTPSRRAGLRNMLERSRMA